MYNVFVGLVDKIRELGRKLTGGRGDQGESDGDGRPSSDDEALPGGASGREAAETTPQRAVELAD